MNNEFIKDVSKGIRKNMEPSETPNAFRRYEPEGGIGKHNTRIHRESAEADRKGNLPYTFRKPYKPLGRPETLVCANCGSIVSGTSVTVGIICSSCGKYSNVIEL